MHVGLRLCDVWVKRKTLRLQPQAVFLGDFCEEENMCNVQGGRKRDNGLKNVLREEPISSLPC